MPSFTRSIAIRRSPEQVFAVLDDLEQATSWMPSIRRIDILTPGMRKGVGFKWRETRRVFGFIPVKVVLVITAHDPGRTWGLTYNDGKVQASAVFELTETPGGTNVVFLEEVEDLQGKPERAERMARMMEKQDGDLLDRLKAYVERMTEPARLAQDEPVVEPARAAKPAKPKPRKPGKAASTKKTAKKAAKKKR